MTRFVLVPGGWHGDWAFDAIGKALASEGHDVQALTLSGMNDETSAGTNLERHIDDVVRAIRLCDTRTVLVGHSYGGMVITGAADRDPSRINAIVYADAYVPDDGASVWSLTTQNYRDRFIAGVADDGLNCLPPAHLDSRCRPHPIATFLQAIRLTGDWRSVPTRCRRLGSEPIHWVIRTLAAGSRMAHASSRLCARYTATRSRGACRDSAEIRIEMRGCGCRARSGGRFRVLGLQTGGGPRRIPRIRRVESGQSAC